MLSQRKHRLSFLLLLMAGVGVSISLALYALRQNVNLYETPQQILQRPASPQQVFRLGGMVVKGSVQYGAGLQVSFVLTDYHANIRVEYRGVLPSLFHEGQGIVAQGRLNEQGVFIADEVLAKHDANYKPPGLTG
jgi:cytochrome c-type biogenesis protein CcmE